MASDRDKVAFSHLFIAIPEIVQDDTVLDALVADGYLDADDVQALRDLRKRAGWAKRVAQAKNKSVASRLIAIAPGIVTRSMVDRLGRWGYLTKGEVGVFRTFLGVYERGTSGKPPTSYLAAMRRFKNVFGEGFAQDVLALLVATKRIDNRAADLIRADILLRNIAAETIEDVRKAKSLYEALALTGSAVADKRMIRVLRLSRIIDTRTAEALEAALTYGKATWRVFDGSRRAEGLAARFAYVLSGSFSFEMVSFLEKSRFINANQKALLKVAVSMAQRYNRTLMEQMTNRKFRVQPNERPIVSYIRASKQTESDLLRLLAEAANDARREARVLAARRLPARSAEYNLRARALHQAMRQIWEGSGYLTIFGEREVADAAISSANMLQSRYYKQLPTDVRLMLERQARSGIDSYISRQENTVALSRRIYRNYDLSVGRVDKAINLGLLQGKSAEEIAKDVEKYINPKAPGGVRYSAYRLARTEMANAFHLTTIRHSREQPWVQGYKWNKSSSHSRPDICDELAGDDHDGLGAGVFKKANVPGKPHPLCLCYLTIVAMPLEQFVSSYNAGRFTRYLDSVSDAA